MATFSKRHYQAIAEVIQLERARARDIYNMDGPQQEKQKTMAAGMQYTLDNMVKRFSLSFQADNPKFDAERFNKACETEGRK